MNGGDEFVVTMEGGRPWGFTLQGGADFRSPLKIGKVSPGGKAEKAGIVPGDIIISINGLPCKSVKHHEAQKMVMTSKDKLALACIKALSLKSPPASASSSLSFEFNSGSPFSPSSSRSSTLTRHTRQSSLDFEPMPRPRSLSDAGRRAIVGEKIAGIKVPAPPPTCKKEEVVVSPSPVRQIAGITIPAPPPSVRSKSKSTGEIPSFNPRSNHPASLPASVPAPVPASLPASLPPASLPPASLPPVSVLAQSEHKRNTAESVSILSSYLERTMKASSQSPRLVAESVGVVEMEAPPLELPWNGESVDPSGSPVVKDKDESSSMERPLTDFEPDTSLPVVTEQCSVVEMKDSDLHIKLPVGSSSSQSNGVNSPVSVKSSPTQDNEDADRPSLTSSTNAEDEVFVHKRASSQGSDWYRQMFNNLKKGVEDDLPNKKNVWDRTPVPAYESTVNFTRNPSSGTPAAKPVTSPVGVKSSLTQDSKDADRPSLTSSTDAEDEGFVHKRASSQGSDWYRQMFNNLKKGVEDDLPNKKHVWDRTPVPARESTVSFTRTPSSETPGAKPATYGQTKRTPSGNYAFSAKISESHTPQSLYDSPRKYSGPASISMQPLRRQTHSASSLEHKPDVVRSSHPTTVYSKNNSRNFASSKNYWKAIETNASKEKTEIQQRSESLKRRRASASSTASSGSQVASISPDLTKDEAQPPPPVPSPEEKSNPPEVTAEISNGVKSPDSQPGSSGEEASPAEDLANQLELQVAEAVEWIQSPLQSGKQFELPAPEPPAANQTSPSPEPTASVDKPIHKPAVEDDEVMAKLHPLLAGDLNDEADSPSVSEMLAEQTPTNVLERIDAHKLHTALGHSVILNQLEQQGASPVALQAAALAVGQSSNQPKQPQQPVKKQPQKKPPPGEKAKALFDFEPATDRELGFKKGDVINLVRQVNQDWLEGSLEGRTGILPVSYIKVLTADDLLHDGAGAPDTTSLNQLAKAKFDFTGKSEKELSFRKGDILTLLKEIDDNWYRASLEDHTGIIPASYITIFDSN